MKKDDLMKFCANKSRGKLKIDQPWSLGGYSFACNGSIIIRLSRLPDVPSSESDPDISRFQFDRQPSQWFNIGHVDPVKQSVCPTCGGNKMMYPCPECEGDGLVNFSTNYNEYECECKTCHGDGQTAAGGKKYRAETCRYCEGEGLVDPPAHEMKRTKYGTAEFSNKLLSLIAGLPNCQIGPFGIKEPARFKFDGGDGIIMPMLPR